MRNTVQQHRVCDKDAGTITQKHTLTVRKKSWSEKQFPPTTYDMMQLVAWKQAIPNVESLGTTSRYNIGHVLLRCPRGASHLTPEDGLLHIPSCYNRGNITTKLRTVVRLVMERGQPQRVAKELLLEHER